MAGTVVDSLLAGSAGAAVGVNTGKPKYGGTLTVGLSADVPNYHIFNGAQGKMDDSGHCIATALYDALFVASANGKTWLPMLALSATPNANYTVWTVALRQGVKFTNGDPFNASIVVQNFQAAAADATVGLAIQPIVKSCTQVNEYTVAYTLLIPFSTFPFSFLSEQQTAFMAHPSSFVSTFTGTPVGTGPFKIKSWQVGVESQFVKNKSYWRTDAANRKLPYLDGINFKIIPDPSTRNSALQSGALDMLLQQDGPSIAALEKMSGISYVTDMTSPRDQGLNFLILNTTGTMNQYFAWAGEFASALNLPGGLSYLEKGQAIPTQVQLADYEGTLGAVNPSTLQWDTTLKPVLNDVTIRQACAMAINRETYFKVIDGGVGAVADGIFKKTSPNYRNPHYPAYNPSAAKKLVDAYKTKNNVSKVSFVIDFVSGSSSDLKAFSFFQQQLAAVGITVTPRPLVASTEINNVIYGAYDCAFFTQFGGIDPSVNYVWFTSVPAATSPTTGGLGMSALPAGTMIAGAVNFSHLGDPAIEAAMLKAMASPHGSATQHTEWAAVNAQMAKDIPYLFLDVTVSAWAARSTVQNWTYSTAGDGRTRCLAPDGPYARWDQVWKS